MALSQVTTSLNLFIHDVNGPKTTSLSKLHTSNFARTAISFIRGSRLVMQKSSCQMKTVYRATASTVRCERSANKGSSLDVWLSRFAMIGFAVAISVEIATGKGLLENIGKEGIIVQVLADSDDAQTEAPLPTSLDFTSLDSSSTASSASSHSSSFNSSDETPLKKFRSLNEIVALPCIRLL
ncbi:hypothetical protein Ancab_017085 [Ancistrocladus abbreviatus]